MTYIVVAYYTENTPYQEEVAHLSASLQRFSLPMDLVGIPSQGSWQANTQYKPYFLKQMLIRHYPKDILYLDADARMQQHPELFDHPDFDLGVVHWDKRELLGGTLYLANKPKVFELIERWMACTFEYPSTWDQKILNFVLHQSDDLNLKICHLPHTYCQIFDLMKHEGDPVIEHFQASRRFKEQID